MDFNMEVMQKLTDEVYNNLYVTSDTHFNHNQDFVYKKRGYESTEMMTQDMIEIINSTVGENGILLHLGDFCLNTTQEQYHYILSRLRIKEIWMLWGNHNNPIQKSYGGTREQVTAYNQGIFIRYLNHYFTFRKGKNVFVCFHFPVQVWDGMNNGTMHLCGHSHGSNNISRPENKTHKILDCGWDIHKKPLTMAEIESIMSNKEVNRLHHA
jgi:calcineurin-like phosphoesterase family protein